MTLITIMFMVIIVLITLCKDFISFSASVY